MKRVQKIDLDTINIDKSYVEIKGMGLRAPIQLSVRNVMNLMQLDIPEGTNMKLVTFQDQDVSINRPPNTYPLDSDLNFAVDENFLYVWINNRWKRIPISEF